MKDTMRHLTRNLLGAVVLLGSVAVGPTEAGACHMAHTVRRFPLGTSGKRLVVLEIDHYRARMSKVKGGVGWTGRARLRFLSIGGKWLKGDVALGRVKVGTKRYVVGLKPLFGKASKRARKLKGFKALKPPKIRFCRFTRKCGGLRLSGKSTGVHVQVAKGTPIRVAYPPTLRADVNQSMWLGGKSYAKASASERTDLARAFGLVSVRTYRWGKRRLIVANLGAGARKFAWPILKSWPKKRCRSTASCIFPEQTLHHGYAFDAIIVTR